jgi:hypothetical protein
MSPVIKLVALVGLVDSVWMTLDPAAWGRFWTGVIAVIRQGGRPGRLVALTQFSCCLYLLMRGGEKK